MVNQIINALEGRRNTTDSQLRGRLSKLLKKHNNAREDKADAALFHDELERCWETPGRQPRPILSLTVFVGRRRVATCSRSETLSA